MPRLSAILLLVLSFPTACVVSQTRYDELQAELDQTRADLAERDEQLANIVRERSALQESVEQMTEALATVRARNAEAARRMQSYQDLLARFRSLIDAGRLQVKIERGRMVVVLPSDVLFRSGDAFLSPDGQRAVREITAVLVTITEREFQVEGHTDNVPIRTALYPSNWELSTARAVNVVKTMIEAGMAPGNVSAAGYGEYRPTLPNTSEENRRANRRIEIVVVPDLSGLPGFEELNELSREENP
ncbi:MAG: OmpA family protein [Spirochaetales bacterium]|nr:OmpA family protein [Leptospiraceae bacterium]MCP5483300.1 OmpA family protein [Spirochaetales bacterium]